MGKAGFLYTAAENAHSDFLKPFLKEPIFYSIPTNGTVDFQHFTIRKNGQIVL